MTPADPPAGPSQDSADGGAIVAAVLAGGRWKGEAPARSSEWRALTPLGGRPMLSYVLETLRQVHGVHETVLVAPPEVAAAFSDLPCLPSAASITENVTAAAAYASSRGRLLLAGSDIPLLQPAAVEDFLKRCALLPVELCYAIIERREVENAYPGMRRTYVRLADGVFTGGNLMFGDPGFLIRRQDRIQELYGARKQPLRLATLLGPEILIRLLGTALLRLPLLSVATASRLVGRTLGGTVAGVPVPYPEIGADLDSPEEIPQYEELLKRRIATG